MDLWQFIGDMMSVCGLSKYRLKSYTIRLFLRVTCLCPGVEGVFRVVCSLLCPPKSILGMCMCMYARARARVRVCESATKEEVLV